MKKEVAHIYNLIAIALKDNDFDEKEKKTIIKIATRLGLSFEDIEKVYDEPKIKIEVPNSLAERIQHLHDLVLVMLADGIVHEEELKYLDLFLNAYGFSDTYDGSPIFIDTQEIKSHLSFQKFIEEYRQTTADVLSSVIVDEEFNIKFPLYKTELLDIGPLPKTLYIFFLLQNEPLNISDLSSEENKRVLENIYSLMPNSDFNVEERIDNLTNPDGLSFNSNRSIIKRALSNALPKGNKEILNHYLISGTRNQKKQVLLNKELIHIQPRIL